MAIPENLRQELLNETNVEVLRGLILVADGVIETLGTKLSLVTEFLKAVGAANNDNEQNSRRYALLKLHLPVWLEIAAYAGSQSERAQEAFASLDPLKLDTLLDSQLDAGVLDSQLDAGVLEQLQAAVAGQASPEQASDDPKDGDSSDDTCGDEDCPYCSTYYGSTW